MMPIIVCLTLFSFLLLLFFSVLFLIDNDPRNAKKSFFISLGFLLLVPIELQIDTKYFQPKRIQEEKQKLYNKYKNGPIKITTNSIGCIKYNYYDDNFWTCPDKNIIQIEERVGKYIVETPVVNTN